MFLLIETLYKAAYDRRQRNGINVFTLYIVL